MIGADLARAIPAGWVVYDSEAPEVVSADNASVRALLVCVRGGRMTAQNRAVNTAVVSSTGGDYAPLKALRSRAAAITKSKNVGTFQQWEQDLQNILGGHGAGCRFGADNGEPWERFRAQKAALNACIQEIEAANPLLRRVPLAKRKTKRAHK